MLKRSFDFLFSLYFIIILSPIFVFVYILSYFFMGSPVLFIQKRPGFKGKIFSIYKFRTMNNKKDSNGNLLPDSKRLVGFGAFLRKTSLDEIPQLFNILKGDMSFVGPRPLLVEYLNLYNENQKQRHNVKPGITGWAQINGRNCISWEDRFNLDVWYVKNYSFILDLKILFLTFLKVITLKDVNKSKNETMPKFTGNSNNYK